MCIPDGFGCGTQLRLGQEREGETIRRWCRRYLRIGGCDERYSYFDFHQTFGQRPNSLAQHTAILLCEQLSNDRQEILQETPAGDYVRISRFARARSCARLGVTRESLRLMVPKCSYATTNLRAALGSGFINSRQPPGSGTRRSRLVSLGLR
jgi:hypothetical protein